MTYLVIITNHITLSSFTNIHYEYHIFIISNLMIHFNYIDDENYHENK